MSRPLWNEYQSAQEYCIDTDAYIDSLESQLQQLREELEKPLQPYDRQGPLGGEWREFYRKADIDARDARMREIAKEANDKAPQAAAEIHEADPQAEAT